VNRAVADDAVRAMAVSRLQGFAWGGRPNRIEPVTRRPSAQKISGLVAAKRAAGLRIESELQPGERQ
jgi:hypothetical protein